ncbi:MAG: DHH family phosphoesterase [Leadbetterella sp.]|nr:DHH family phosphoesterase [Leadbetterella sp.]
MSEKTTPTIYENSSSDIIDGNKAEKKERKKNGTEEYAYSELLNKFISYKPLRINEQVVRAATELEIELSWNDSGYIENIGFVDANRLMKKMGSSLLSPSEFWQAYNEAKSTGNHQLVDEFESKEFTEWFDAVYTKNNNGEVSVIEHPEIVIGEGGHREYIGESKVINMPVGRPGWFKPGDGIDPANSMPLDIKQKREKGDVCWKYWSVFKTEEYVAPIRGYVTSSGTPSFDLDIPVDAKQPVLMLRECRNELSDSAFDPEIMRNAENLTMKYRQTIALRAGEKNDDALAGFYDQRESVLTFLKENCELFSQSKDKTVLKYKERMIDALGLIRLQAKDREEESVVSEIDSISRSLFEQYPAEANFQNFSEFIGRSSDCLRDALKEKKKIVFVMGHKNPDTDTSVSCIMEAYRNNLVDDETIYLPVIQGSKIPDEVRRLIGDELADSIILSEDVEYETAANSGQAKWILVDQNVSDVQKFAISIIDHHALSEKSNSQDISLTWEMAGSTTALISQKFQGMGIEVDDRMAHILYGATLMDTENRNESKMTSKDVLIMNNLKTIANCENDNDFYQDLMDHLLNTDDVELLFNRDYKEDWGFGFAVAKVKGAFDEDGYELKGDLIRRFEKIAQDNNKANNYPLTIVKLVDYLADNETINRERFMLVYNDHASSDFKAKMEELLQKIIKKEFGNEARVESSKDVIDFWGTGKQLSRKKIAPHLEKVNKAFNEYYFSESTGLNLSREFLKISAEVSEVAQRAGIKLSVDEEGRINNITFSEARKILDGLGFVSLSLSEYWKALEGAKHANDRQMIEHLQCPGFVEYLDTVIIDKQYIVDHPEVEINENGNVNFVGERKSVNLLQAEPGLISPSDINKETGIPEKIRDPRQYGDKELWRYWSPDADLVSVTRGHIFLLGQPALDTKIYLDEALPNLGIRPCCKEVKTPSVIIDDSGKDIKIIIEE